MNSYLSTTLILGLLAGSALAQEKPDLKNPKERISYSIGANIGGNFKRQDMDIDPKALAAGIADALAGKTALTEAEMRETLNNFSKEMTAKMEAKQKTDGEKTAKKGRPSSPPTRRRRESQPSPAACNTK